MSERLIDLFALMDVESFAGFKEQADRSPLLRVLCDRQGDSLLHYAARRGSPEICRFLIGKGISITMPGKTGASPLHYAAERGDTAVMEALLEGKPYLDPANANGMTPMHVAAGAGHLQVVQMLVDRGAQVDAADKYGRQPIQFAAGAGQLDVVKAIAKLDRIFLNAPDNFGQTALHWALAFEQAETTLWLIGQGGDLLAPDLYGRPALFFAAISKNPALNKRITEEVGSKQAELFEKYQSTPLHDAVLQGDTDVSDRILRGGFDINQQDTLGRTALHATAFEKDWDMYDWLKDQHADTKIQDDYGWSAIKLMSYRLLGKRE